MSTEHKAYAMLIKTDAGENNNKFYEIILDSNDVVHTRWGRVGATGQSGTSSGGQYEFDRVKRSKVAKGYKETKISGKVVSTETLDKESLKKRAAQDLLGDNAANPVMVNLVNHLTEVNRHQLSQASSGNITIDDSGMVMTPLGMVTLSTVQEARNLLQKLNDDVAQKMSDKKSYVSRLENYLTLIPQKIPTRRGWDSTFFTGFTTFEAQNSLLDQLEGSVDLYEKKKQEALDRAAAGKDKELPRMFETQISLVTDPAIIREIQNMFVNGASSSHVSSKLKLKRVFELKNDTFQNRFDAKAKEIGNVQRYWHGTRAFNVLSILRGGLIIPKSNGNYHISGRMFGDGVYFSDNSTKSLNYSYGYWGGGGYDNNCFMFVADVAMGKVHRAKSYTEHLPRAGYDSTFAEGGVAGVANNEMIVYSLDQVNLKYLCEFQD